MAASPSPSGIWSEIQSLLAEGRAFAEKWFLHAVANGGAVWAVAVTDISKLRAAVTVVVVNAAATFLKFLKSKL